jgi:hypothetical protein
VEMSPITWLLVLQFMTASGQQQLASVERGGLFEAAYKRGEAEADKEWEAGKATLFMCGLPWEFGSLLDEETGLPLKPITGCVVDGETLGRVSGHNQRIRQFIAKGGVPKNTFKGWEKELLDLKNYFRRLIKTQEPFHRRLGTEWVWFCHPST